MSGGSYNYLYLKGSEDLLDGQGYEELNEMAETLLDMGYEEEAKETFSIQFEVKKTRQKGIAKKASQILEARVKKIQGVWKAVEWYQSNDSGIGYVQKEIEKYRQNQGE